MQMIQTRLAAAVLGLAGLCLAWQKDPRYVDYQAAVKRSWRIVDMD